MTFGSKQDGTGYLVLSPSELKDFEAGKTVRKVSGDARGIFTITAKLTRPRRLTKRFPAAMGYDANHRNKN